MSGGDFAGRREHVEIHGEHSLISLWTASMRRFSRTGSPREILGSMRAACPRGEGFVCARHAPVAFGGSRSWDDLDEEFADLVQCSASGEQREIAGT